MNTPNGPTADALKPCLFNCVVYCQQQERFEYCLELARGLASYFPCRLFFMQHLKEKGLNHYTQSREGLSGWGANFYDTLFVETSSDQLYRVPFSLFPFLVPELPIMLFWDADPTEEKEVLPIIWPYANRLIFDSETISNLATFARRMPHFETNDQAKEQVDLNWARLSGWRELLAKVFDTQERVEHLRASSEVRIFYNARENRFFHHSQTEALYLQAYLAAQMGWQYEAKETQNENKSLRVLYQFDGHPIRVIIQPLEIQQRAPGSLLCIEVTSRLGTEVTMDSRELPNAVRVKSICDASCTLPYVLPLRGRLNSRFFQQLLYQDVNKHYEAMLQMLAQQE